MLRRNRMALKEWASVVGALGKGLQILLLRKGGLVEEAGEFRLAASEFFLYPTYEHQQADLLQPQYAEAFRELGAKAAPQNGLVLGHYAVVTDDWPAPALSEMKQLRDRFVWNETFLEKRYEYKPELPLRLLVVRTYQLPQPARLPERPEYAGCRSWVELEENLSTDGVLPVLADEEFQRHRELLRQRLL